MEAYLQPRPGIITRPLLDATTCTYLIDQATDAWQPAGVMRKDGQTHVKTETRAAFVKVIGTQTDAGQLLHDRIKDVVRPLVQQRWRRAVHGHEPFQLVRYAPGGFYTVHRDVGAHNPRRFFTVVCYLNDDFTGGGTHFPDAAYTVEPKQGHVLVFPADYRHCAEPVCSGTKYIAVTWLLGPSPVRWI